jgi:hypothetical protein
VAVSGVAKAVLTVALWLPPLTVMLVMLGLVASCAIHSSRPLVPSAAEKNSVPLTLVRERGYEPPLPGRMSWTRTVPAAVPSDFHSSRPLVPAAAEKNSVPLTLVSL